MTYGELKKRVSSMLLGDYKLPEDELLTPIVDMSIIYINSSLMYSKTDEVTFLFVDDNSEIENSAPQLDLAIAHMCRSYISDENGSFYLDFAQKYIDLYIAEIENIPEEQ